MIRVVAKLNPELTRSLARLSPDQLYKHLRKNVQHNAQPTLERVKAETPVQKGLLKQSMGVTMGFNRSFGEVFAIVSPRDNTTVANPDGSLTFYTSMSLKKLRAKGDKRLRGLHAKGITQVSQKTPFLYVYGVETGLKRSGKLARKAGGAKMIERGYDEGREHFPEAVGGELMSYVTTDA